MNQAQTVIKVEPASRGEVETFFPEIKWKNTKYLVYAIMASAQHFPDSITAALLAAWKAAP